MPAHWWVELVPEVSGYSALWVLGLVSAHWFVGPSFEPSGVQDQALGWLWAQGGLKAANLLVDGALSLPS